MTVCDSEIKMEQKIISVYSLLWQQCYHSLQCNVRRLQSLTNFLKYFIFMAQNFITLRFLCLAENLVTLFCLQTLFCQCLILQKGVLNARVITGRTFRFIIFRFTSECNSVFDRLELLFLLPLFVRLILTLLSSAHVHEILKKNIFF